MSESVNLPALGESVTEGTVTRWLKNVGDSVAVDEPLLEVSTDKVDTEIPSPVAGVIEEILVAEDETVEVGTALVRIGDGSGGGTEDAAPQADAAESDQEQPQQDDRDHQDEQQQEAALAGEAPAGEASAEAAPVGEAPAEAAGPDSSSPADAASTSDSTPIEEVPSNDAPAPGEDDAEMPTSPEPADAVDAPPAARQENAPASVPEPATIPAPAAVPAAAAAPPAPAPPAAPATPPEAASSASPSAPPAHSPEATSAPAGDGSGSSNAGYVTPLVRKLANDSGVDLSSVTGTGVGGRIRREDVLAAQKPEASATPAATPPTDASTAGAVKLETSPLRGTTVPMSRLRKVISERAVQSMQASAQLTSVVEVDVTRVATLRASVKDGFQQKAGVKLSFLPFFALAAAEALKAYPIVNATIDTESNSIVYPDHENLSIAVDTERGLLTPVIRNAADLDLAGLAQQIADLAARTRDNKLKPDELAGGTFTLTNTGSRGALFDTPLVFLPQSAILGTGIVTKKPVVISHDGSDAIAIRSTVYLALSYDHRIVDGADAARFLVAVKNRLEAGEFHGDLGI